MYLAELRIDFYLHGCSSLKEKRQRLAGLRDKFGTNKNIAVGEGGPLNNKERSELFFVCIANNRKVVESSLARITNFCRSSVDAEMLHHQIEWF